MTMEMKEFDPRCERHYPLLMVKAVEPGCTTEWQIENCQTGEITRLSTTDDEAYDKAAYLNSVLVAATDAWDAYASTDRAVGTVAFGGEQP